jgi:hypothetical protein
LAAGLGGAIGLQSWRIVEYGLAASIHWYAPIIGGLAAGLVIALIADAVLPRCTRTAPDPHCPAPVPPRGTGDTESGAYSASATLQRLAEEKASLEHLDAERAYRGDPGFGKTTEHRILWNELLDLELQDIDERVNRICQAAAEASGHRSRTSDSNYDPHSH